MWWRRRPSDPAPTPQEALEERLSAYLDGEVTEAERSETETLLASDASARAYLDDLQLMTRALASLEPVRAPRSFAIPAPAAAGAPAALRAFPGANGVTVLARRMEWAMRASAAAAALLFVVALTYNPGGLTNTAADSASTLRQAETSAVTAPAAGAAESGGGAGGGADGGAPADNPVPAPATPADGAPPADDAGTQSGDAPVDDGGTDDGQTDDGQAEDLEAMGTLMAPDASNDGAEDDGARTGTNDGAGDSDQTRYEPLGEAGEETAQFRGPEAGTVAVDSSSDGVGGVAPALGTLAILLAVLSVMVGRKDEQGSIGRR